MTPGVHTIKIIFSQGAEESLCQISSRSLAYMQFCLINQFRLVPQYAWYIGNIDLSPRAATNTHLEHHKCTMALNMKTRRTAGLDWYYFRLSDMNSFYAAHSDLQAKS